MGAAVDLVARVTGRTLIGLTDLSVASRSIAEVSRFVDTLAVAKVAEIDAAAAGNLATLASATCAVGEAIAGRSILARAGNGSHKSKHQNFHHFFVRREREVEG